MITKQQIITYKIAKILFFIDVIFVGFYQNRFTPISGISSILAISIIAFFMLSILSGGISFSRLFRPAYRKWLLFAVFALLFGVLTAQNLNLLFDRLFLYTAAVFIMMFILYSSYMDDNIDFIVIVFLILGLLIALTLIFGGVIRYNGTNMYFALSDHSNRNGESCFLLFGIFSVLYLNKFEKITTSFFSLGAIGVQAYAIILGASRKGMIGIAILVAVWLLFSYRKKAQSYSLIVKLFHLFVFLIFIALTIRIVYPWITQSYAFERLFGDAGIDSSNERKYLAEQAWAIFKSHPIFGVGFNQFRTYAGAYAHSNYYELLADTGMIGFALYYGAYINIFVEMIRNLSSIKGRDEYSRCVMGIGLFVTMLILETALVTCQDYLSLIAIGVIAAIAYMPLVQNVE